MDGMMDGMTDEMKELIYRAAMHVMTPEEVRAQRISFVYGTCKMSNPLVTREMVERIVDESDRKREWPTR